MYLSSENKLFFFIFLCSMTTYIDIPPSIPIPRGIVQQTQVSWVCDGCQLFRTRNEKVVVRYFCAMCFHVHSQKQEQHEIYATFHNYRDVIQKKGFID